MKTYPTDPIQLLDARPELEHYSKRLGSGSYALDTPMPRDPSFNDEEMSAEFVFAAASRDRVGDVLEISGIRCDAHRFNPIVCLDHAKWFRFPVGKAEDPDRNYTVVCDDVAGEGRCKVFFSRKLHEAEQTYELMKEGILRAGSIGYRLLKAAPIPANKALGFPPGLHLIEVELLEATITALPANGDAVREVISKGLVCGKSLAPAIKQTLEPYASKAKSWSSGVTIKAPTPEQSIATKQMDEEIKAEPVGAMAMRAIHGNLKMARECYKQYEPLLENPVVKDHLNEWSGSHDESMSGMKDAFGEFYPDLDALEEDEEQEEADDMSDTEKALILKSLGRLERSQAKLERQHSKMK